MTVLVYDGCTGAAAQTARWLCKACRLIGQFVLSHVSISIHPVTDLTFDTHVAAWHEVSLSRRGDSVSVAVGGGREGTKGCSIISPFFLPKHFTVDVCYSNSGVKAHCFVFYYFSPYGVGCHAGGHFAHFCMSPVASSFFSVGNSFH